jgi:hypothetical protein
MLVSNVQKLEEDDIHSQKHQLYADARNLPIKICKITDYRTSNVIMTSGGNWWEKKKIR